MYAHKSWIVTNFSQSGKQQFVTYDLAKASPTTLASYSNKTELSHEISGIRRSIVEAFALLGCYAAYVGSWLPYFGLTYRLHLQGSSSPRNVTKRRNSKNITELHPNKFDVEFAESTDQIIRSKRKIFCDWCFKNVHIIPHLSGKTADWFTPIYEEWLGISRNDVAEQPVAFHYTWSCRITSVYVSTCENCNFNTSNLSQKQEMVPPPSQRPSSLWPKKPKRLSDCKTPVHQKTWLPTTSDSFKK